MLDHLNDLDSILVTMHLFELKQNPFANEMVYLSEFTINLRDFSMKSLK